MWLFFIPVAFAYGQKVPRKMDLFLLVGQSNMAGRGVVEATDREVTPGLWVIDASDEWVPAVDPLHYDKPAAVGVGPGTEFGRALLRQRPGKAVGLIPCAVGGSRISDWEKGARHSQTGIYPYEAMLARARQAMKRGKLKAILWHQGEGDSSPDRAGLYEKRLEEFFTRLRKDLGAEGVPVIVATLGDFYVKKVPSAAVINRTLTEFPGAHPDVYAVSSAGLTHKGDTTHFDAASARELGRRYAEAYLKISAKK